MREAGENVRVVGKANECSTEQRHRVVWPVQERVVEVPKVVEIPGISWREP
jgi:hypothetical protein